ncbi:MAG: tol-pal system protein YbgF [Alphaproteobacteria bacterium]|nr:tol-pal system protein YbgF [Alphaproteobacteria bacterium]
MKQLLLAFLLLSAVPAVADLQSDMINDRLDRLDREMTLMQKKLYTSGTMATSNTPQTADTAGMNDLYGQIDEQNKVIADLTRKIEELSHTQEVLQNRLSQMQQDVDFRFREKEQPTQPVSKKKNNTQLSDQEAYDKAYNLLVKTKYIEAEQAFTAFLKDYPNSKLAGNANYWLGETFYVRGQYEVAAGIFSDGLTKYEKSAKAPDNLLKLGLTMAQLNKKEEACGFLTLLPEQFPTAAQTLKQRATQEAKKLSCP